MSASRWGRHGLAVASGVVLGLARPPVDRGALAFVALVPLLWLWHTDRPRTAALHGLLAGCGYYGAVVAWAWYFGAIAVVPFVLALAAYWAVAGAMIAALRRAGYASPLLSAAVWVVLEGLMARWPLGGFSWGELGYAMHDIAPFRSLASVGGVALVSFAVVAINASLCDAVIAFRSRSRGALARASLVVVVVFGIAVGWFIVWPQTQVSGQVHFALLQGNDKNRDLTEAELAARYLPERHFALAATLHGHYDLVVFPESSLDTDPRGDVWLNGRLADTARRLHSFVLANGVGDAPDGRALNLDVLYDRRGRVVGTYAKRHLVPFGEWVPLRSTLTRFIGALDRIPRDFKPGPTPGLFRIAGHQVATVTCFESAFGYEVRPLVRDGAELIVVSTNNRSYRRSANSWQHVSIGQLRAAETGRSVLQSSISGHTAVIDARGNVVRHTDLFHNAVLQGNVATRTGLTLYTRFGEWVLVTSLIVTLAVAAVAMWRRLRRGRPRSVESALEERNAVGTEGVV